MTRGAQTLRAFDHPPTAGVLGFRAFTHREAPTHTHLTADLAVTLPDDRPGMLATAIGCVAAAGINIDGYIEMNGVVHVLSTDLQRTRRCLHDAGFRVMQEQQVVVVPVEDVPGAAAGVFQRIGE